MKGLSIGRAELVSRFLSTERRRLGRSLESSSFHAEMQRQSDRISGGSPVFPQAAVLAGKGTVSSSMLVNERLSRNLRTVLGAEKSQKPELEIADPLLLQEILATFSATAEIRKKVADRTGGQGALAVQDLISFLDIQEKEVLCEEQTQEQIPAEVFRKLLNALRWSDDKHQAVMNLENLGSRDAYDQQSFIEALKNLLRKAEAQRDALAEAPSVEPPSPSSDIGPSQDILGTAGMADALPEDFVSPWNSASFSLWQGPGSDEKPQRELRASETNSADEEKKPQMIPSPNSENRRSQEVPTLLGANGHAGDLEEAAEPASSRLQAAISHESLPPLARDVSFQASTFHPPGFGVPSAESAPSLLFFLDDSSLLQQEDLKPLETSARSPVVHPGEAPKSGTESTTPGPTANAPIEASGGGAAASLDTAGEIQEIARDFSQPMNAEEVDDLFQEANVLLHDTENGRGSSLGDSTPFGEGSSRDPDGLFQPSPQAAKGEPLFSVSNAPQPSRTTPQGSSAALSLLHADWPKELAQTLSHCARSGKSFMTLELQPESLGKLFLRVEADGTRVNAVIQSEHPEAREVLLRNLASLRDVLAENGLQLTRFSVDVRHDHPSFAERDLARWAPAEQPSPATSPKRREEESILSILNLDDTGLGRALSVRV